MCVVHFRIVALKASAKSDEFAGKYCASGGVISRRGQVVWKPGEGDVP
jgi:hypothetical protein